MPSRDEKTRRKALRKAAGLKRFSEILAARQSRQETQFIRRTEALMAYGCFTCRKSFKKRYDPARAYKCPQCAREMADLGRSFKAPRKSDIRQWQKIERLWQAGYRFHTNTRRLFGPPFPRTLQEVDDWIANNPRHPFRRRDDWPDR
jgi:DNA-directed RNA polymerase subunit RPC12/RpoP